MYLGEKSAVEWSRMAALLRVLAGSPDGDAVCHAIRWGVLDGTGAEEVTIHGADSERAHLLRLGCSSSDDGEGGGWLPVTTRLPVCEAFRSGAEVALEGPRVAELYPLAVLADHEAVREGVISVALPLRGGGVVMGVLALRFAMIQPPHGEGMSLLRVMADAVGLWAAPRCPRTGPARTGRTPITERQVQVLQMVQAGCSNGQIARRLGFAEATIKADLTALYRLLGAHSRHGLIEEALRVGLVEPVSAAS